jgi:hypothetical protein
MEMLIYVGISLLVSLAVSLLTIKGQKNRMQAQEVEVTTAEEGVPQKVVLGTRDVKASVVWFGDQRSQAIKK